MNLCYEITAVPIHRDSNPIPLSPAAELAARLVEAMADGLNDAGILASYKHFPGHGDTDVDSHVGLPCVDKTMEELEACE